MRRYCLDGIELESDVFLGSLEALAVPADARGRERDVVRLAAGEVPTDRVSTWETRASGLSFGREDGRHVIRYGDEIAFSVDASGGAITCWHAGSTPKATVEQIFLDQVLPLVLHLRGRFAFHGSAAARGELAVGFLGESGRGKSTLASSLAQHASGALVCDDCLAVSIDGALARVHPSYASARLWPTSADALFADRGDLPRVSPRSDKRRVGLAVRAAPVPLARIYLLEHGVSHASHVRDVRDVRVTIDRLRGATAVFSLARHLFRFDHDARELLVRELAFLEALASRVPVATLTYPRAFAELGRVHDAILEDLMSSAG